MLIASLVLVLGPTLADGPPRERDFVLALWRHGARSPMEFDNFVGDNLDIWPDGTGQLTEYGVELHQELGTFLRHRYQDLLPTNEYRRKDIYVRSTDRDRTLESAVANLGRFYNVSTPGYVPFPVHTMPVEMDNLRYPNMRCKRYAEIQSELVSTPKMKELNEQYHADLKRMGELVNSTIEYTIQNMWHILDTIDCHIANNITGKVPPEFSGEYLARLRKGAGIGMLTLFTDPEFQRRIEVSRMQGGVLLGDIISQLRHPLIQGDFDKPVKYLVYSAHDTTLAATLAAMNTMIDDFYQPYYASAILFERYNDGTVEIFYRNGSDPNAFFDITQQVCDHNPCTLDDLHNAWDAVIPENWDAECHNMDPSPELAASNEKTITALCIILTGSWAVFIAYFFFTRKKVRSGDRLALIETEFSMSTDYDKSWSAVPAASFTNPSI